ncbi:MAG: hypothetical protein K6E85_01385 [Lachnospiraceae bacterium]|nr:hypothetical protein [Lachnospiraceae bacterium]
MKVTDHIEIIFPNDQFAEKAAKLLYKKMLSYKTPTPVIEKTGFRTIRDVKDSRIIVVCCPATRNDPKIKRMISERINAGKRNSILTLLAEGTPDESFPEELLYEILPDGTCVEREPLAANITAPTERRSLSKINVETLRILAPIFGVPFDDLMDRNRRRKKTILFSLTTVISITSLIFMAYAFSKMYTISGQNKQVSAELSKAEAAEKAAESERNKAVNSLLRSVALKAREVLDSGDTELALMIAFKYLSASHDTPELTAVFEETLHTRCAQGYVPLTTYRAYKRTRPKITDTVPANKEEPSTSEINEQFWDLMSDHDVSVFSLPNGQKRILIDQKDIYDGLSGSYLYSLQFFGQTVYTAYNPLQMTAEGLLPLLIGNTLFFIDLTDGNIIAFIKDEENTRFEIIGEKDPITGRNSGKFIYISGKVWEYNETEIPVPQDLNSQIKLAEQLLSGRLLTEKEKRDNSLK